MKNNVSIIILNWNGKELLAENLPSVIAASENYQNEVEILVVDNGSADGSVDFVKSNYPQLNVMLLNKNYGFGEGNNFGVKQAKGDVVILLNNDMSVDSKFIGPLVKPFEEDQTVFAVGSQIYFQDKTKRREETGKTFAYWDNGIIRYLHQDVTELDYERKYIPIFWASGGAAAYDRKKFLELGGFNSIYSPAYVEDVDVSYRAKTRGWKNLFSSESIVYHKHRASSEKRFSETDIEILTKRNHLLFIWSNIFSKKMLIEHLFGCLYRLFKNIFDSKRRVEWSPFIQALPLFRHARRLNKQNHLNDKISDNDLLKNNSWKIDFLKEKQKLSILFVCPYIPCLNVHATGTRMYHIIKELSKRNDVSILTYLEEPEEKQRIGELKTFCKNVTTVLRRQSLDEPDYFHIIPNMVVKEFCQQEMKEALTREALSGKYDIIQFEYLQMAYLAKLVKNLGIPMIMVDHEIQHAALWREFKIQKLISWKKAELLFRWMVMLSFELSVAKRFRHIITVTDKDNKELKKYLPNLKTSIIPLGVDLDFYSPANSIEEENNSLIFTGYFLHSPNVDAVQYFVDFIFPRVRKEVPNTKFYIVGALPTSEVKALANKDGVIVTGWVPELRHYLQKATVYVASIRLGVGFRGKLIEAFAMGKAVVATSIAASGMPVEDRKSIMIADSPDLFAEQVIFLLKNKTVRKQMGAEARKIVEKYYSWEQIAQKNEKAILNVIQNKK